MTSFSDEEKLSFEDKSSIAPATKASKQSFEDESSIAPVMKASKQSLKNQEALPRNNNTILNDILSEILSSTDPSLRHLGSQSSLGNRSTGHISSHPKRLSTPVADQRHPGKPGAWIHKSTRNLDDIQDWGEAEEPIPFSPMPLDGLEDNTQMELESVHPGPLALTLLMIGLCLSVFLISLDRTIVTTVCNFPRNSKHFHMELFFLVLTKY